jgi:hypothetical protein
MPNTYTELRRTVLGTATNTVTFDLTGISGYTDLVLVSDTVGTASFYSLRLNADSTALYSRTRLVGDGTSATSSRQSGQTEIIIDGLNSTNRSMSTIHFMNYSNTTTNKTILARTAFPSTDTAALVGLYRSTAAITSISLFMNSNSFSVGSTFSLYGIANADQGAAKATGGIITEDSQYWYHTFGASSAFIPKQSLTCDVLVLAGGGGGAGDRGGGGGAGGFRTSTGLSVTATTYNVTVGAGGAGGGAGANGTKGSNSIFSTITSTGGGFGGGTYASGNGGIGGSGGGGRGAVSSTTGGAGNEGSYSPVEGFAGGAENNNGTTRIGGGGGGGSEAGNTVAAGRGGNGATSSFTGVSVVYAGGGGAGSLAGGTIAGGTGGGGQGVQSGNGSAGTVNLGGGGGGSGDGATTGAAGGSGVVIIRYAK